MVILGSGYMSNFEVEISGLTREYPNFKYGTQELMDILGNKLSDQVKENISLMSINIKTSIRLKNIIILLMIA